MCIYTFKQTPRAVEQYQCVGIGSLGILTQTTRERCARIDIYAGYSYTISALNQTLNAFYDLYRALEHSFSLFSRRT